MTEYIKREDAYQYLDNEVEWKVNQDRLCALEVISDFPAADVAEVRYGRWIAEQFQTVIPVEYDEFGEPVLHDHIVYRCSQCGRVNHKKEPYCNCGARMDKENEQ